MIGIDTNVLVRYLAQDDEKQSSLATALIESFNHNRRGFISLIVLVETVWVMERVFRSPRNEIVGILEDILGIRDLVVEHSALAWRALDRFSKENCDFSDCLIAEIAHQVGCTETFTFDQKAAKRAGMKLLED
ncbi:PIN domain-containing protein [Chitinimonas lacunae]|uniref:Ribonuclease VapC n=1 Tax=Chitinimonas lacunae TaxID=1963018 RepID=A0ABV8MZ26_9NEIS